MTDLKPGDPAPDFSLSDTHGNVVQLSDLRGKWVVLYFYPRDNTPGCTKEACGFRDTYPEFEKTSTVILGVSMDDQKSHAKFVQKLVLPFPLLCDRDASVATAYGSYGLKKFMGKEYMGILRHTFIINPEGKIAHIYRKVKPEVHAQEVVRQIETLAI